MWRVGITCNISHGEALARVREMTAILPTDTLPVYSNLGFNILVGAGTHAHAHNAYVPLRCFRNWRVGGALLCGMCKQAADVVGLRSERRVASMKGHASDAQNKFCASSAGALRTPMCLLPSPPPPPPPPRATSACLVRGGARHAHRRSHTSRHHVWWQGNSLAQIHGVAYADLIADSIVEPLGLTNTGVDVNTASREHLALPYTCNEDVLDPANAACVFPQEIFNCPYCLQDYGWGDPAGGMFSSAKDLGKLMSFVFRDRADAHATADQILSGASIRETLLPRFIQSDRQGEPVRGTLVLGMAVACVPSCWQHSYLRPRAIAWTTGLAHEVAPLGQQITAAALISEHGHALRAVVMQWCCHAGGFALTWELYDGPSGYWLRTKRGDVDGYASEMIMVPELKLGIVTLSNVVEHAQSAAQALAQILVPAFDTADKFHTPSSDPAPPLAKVRRGCACCAAACQDWCLCSALSLSLSLSPSYASAFFCSRSPLCACAYTVRASVFVCLCLHASDSVRLLVAVSVSLRRSVVAPSSCLPLSQTRARTPPFRFLRPCAVAECVRWGVLRWNVQGGKYW